MRTKWSVSSDPLLPRACQTGRMHQNLSDRQPIAAALRHTVTSAHPDTITATRPRSLSAAQSDSGLQNDQIPQTSETYLLTLLISGFTTLTSYLGYEKFYTLGHDL